MTQSFYGICQEEFPVLKKIDFLTQYHETMKSMEFLSRTLHDYVEHFNKAPEAENIKELMKQDCGNGLTFAEFFFDELPFEQIPIKDVWENAFYFKSEKDVFWIASAGSDGKFEGFRQCGAYPATESYIQGRDIILSSRGFTLYPIEKEKAYFFFSMLFTAFSKI